MKKLILSVLLIIPFISNAQFPGTDSLRNFNNRFITNEAMQAFTNLRLHNLLSGIIDFIDSSRGGSSVSLGVDTMYVTADSVFHYRKNGVFRQFVIRGQQGAGKIYEVPYSDGNGKFANDSNFKFDKSQGVNNSRLIVGPTVINDGGLSKINATSDNMNAASFSSFGTGTNTIIFRRSLGSVGLPLAITEGTDLWNFSGRGYTGSVYTTSRANIYARTTEDWTDTTHGTKLVFSTTHNDSSTMRDRMTLDNDGRLYLHNYKNLPETVDNTYKKPLAIDSNGKIWQFAGWPGGGSSSADSTIFNTVYRSDTAKANIRSICQWPSERAIGALYEKNTWVNSNEFTKVGSASLTLNGNYLDLSGGDGTFGNNYVRLLPVTNLSKWKVTVILKLSSTLNSGDGMAGGLVHANSVNPFDLTGNISFGNTGSSNVYAATTQGGGTVYATSSGTLSFSANNLIKIVYELKDSTFTTTATNLTTAGSPVPVTYTWSTPSAAAGEIPNSCYFALYPNGGTQQIQYIKIESDEIRYPSVALFGDSKWQVGFADHWSQRVGNQLNPSYGTTITRAGEGDGVNNLLDGTAEMRLIAPRVAILQIGSNSKRAGFTDAQIIAAYDSLTTAIEAIGTKVLHVVFPEDTVDAPGVAVGMSFIKQHIAYKYSSNYINTWDTLADGSNRLKSAFDFGDGAHLNQAGINAIVTKIIQSGKVTVCNERIADDNFIITQIENASSSSGSTGGINNQTTLQTSANFNIDGIGKAAKFSINPSNSSYSTVELTNYSASATDAPMVIRPNTNNTSTELYIVPRGTGSGGNLTAFNLFNSDYIADPSNFGNVAAQMKATEFDFHTIAIGSGTLASMKFFTGSNDQLTLNTNGTSRWGSNVFFNTQIGIGPSFTTPFSKSLLHSNKSVNDAVYNMVSNSNTGNGVIAGFKANLDPARDDTNYISMIVLGANYSQPSRPTLGGGSTMLETTAPGNMYISAHNDTGNIVITTDTSMVPRMKIAHGGAITFGTGSSSYTFPTTRATAGQVLTDVSGTGAVTWETMVLKGSTTWQPGVVAAGSSASTTLTVTGAATTDVVHVNKVTGGLSNGEVYDAWVSATNTVTIRVHNVSTGSANYNTTDTYHVVLLKY